jgi:hypothetical protein
MFKRSNKKTKKNRKRDKMKYKDAKLAKKRPAKSINLIKYNPGFDMNRRLDYKPEFPTHFLRLNR